MDRKLIKNNVIPFPVNQHEIPAVIDDRLFGCSDEMLDKIISRARAVKMVKERYPDKSEGGRDDE